MKYVGIQSQQSSNNFKSILLLICFPLFILLMTWVGLALFGVLIANADGVSMPWQWVNETFLTVLPWEVGGVAIWFVCAYLWNSHIVKAATGAKPLERRENMRVYNITENLCMSIGMEMPKLYVVQDPAPNAFASGINDKSYAVTVTSGLLDTLDDKELAGVIAHELTHIRNRDTRLLITSIVFVGIISVLMSVVVRVLFSVLRSSGSSSDDDEKDSGAAALAAALIALVCVAIAWLFTSLTRFALSRKREYMADAGGAELCGEPWALASALRKISGNAGLANANEDMVALFIARPGNGVKKTPWYKRIWSTHPDINERIAILEQF